MDNGNTLRSSSLSKRRRKEDDFLPRQSVSRAGSGVVSERTIPGSAKRTSSPSRYLTELRTARPLISLSPITMPPKPLSDDTMTRLGRLRRRLGNVLKGGYIPGGLKDAIEQDPDFHLYSRAPFSVHRSEETRMHSASALSSHLLNLLSNFMARTSGSLRVCNPKA
ncbi:hypothetical protein K469DRAFT_747136 [Zopfia rhizophila CBS 207.26]|uniref:Uncharacterized protein n=1 Tax=Zopfia rhizophila CBS 207.26 TaxID=1314779 RepID=A0A6A6EG66_9PEZI|nr:hypothetical protein K469DRAFT_747136 [Zopfia rhizophila CBS 207.26]